MKRILVGTDFSATALRAADFAAALAKQLGAELVLASAVEVPFLDAPVGSTAMRNLTGELEGYISGQLQDEAERLATPGLKIITELRRGNAARELVTLAENPDVEMVVVGSRGASALTRALLGNVPSRLAQICTKPLLIVPAEHKTA